MIGFAAQWDPSSSAAGFISHSNTLQRLGDAFGYSWLIPAACRGTDLTETYLSPTKLLFTSSTKRPLWEDGINIRVEDELDAASQNLLVRSHRQEEEGRSNHELL